MSKYEYIVISSKDGGTLICKNCEKEMKLPLPASIEMTFKITDQFKKEHKSCQVKPRVYTPAPQPFGYPKESIDYDQRN
jgi:hypothetical protein